MANDTETELLISAKDVTAQAFQNVQAALKTTASGAVSAGDAVRSNFTGALGDAESGSNSLGASIALLKAQLSLAETELRNTARSAATFVGPQAADFNSGVQGMADKVAGLKAQLEQLQPPTNQFTSLVERLTERVAIYAALRGAFDFTKELLASAVSLEDMSQKTDLSIDTLQKMQFVAGQTGTTLDSFSGAAFKAGVNIQAGGAKVQDAADRMHVSLEALQAMSPDEQWNAIIHGLESITDAQQRNLAGTEIFGKGAKDIMASIAKGYTDLANAATLSGEDQIRAVKDASDALDRFEQNAKNKLIGVAGDFALAGEQIGNESWWQTIGAFLTMGPGAISALAAAGASNARPDVSQYQTAGQAAAAAADPNQAAKDKAQAAADAAQASFDNDVAGLMDKLGGGAAAKQVAELEDAFVSLGGATKLSGQQLKAFADAADKLYQDGARLPPNLMNIVIALEKFGPAVQDGLPADFFTKLTGMSAQAAKDIDQILGNDVAQKAHNLNDEYNYLSQSGLLVGTAYDTVKDRAIALLQAGVPLSQNLYDLAGGFEALAPKVQDGLSQFPGEMIDLKSTLADFFNSLNDPNDPSFGSAMLDSLTTGLDKVPKVLEGAFSGNGSIASSLEKSGTDVGIQLGGTATEGLATSLHLGVGKVGSAVSALGGPLGAAAVSLGIDLGKKLWDSMFGDAGRQAVVQFANSMGGFDSLHAQLSALGSEGEQLWIALTQGTGSNNAAQAAANIAKVQAALAALTADVSKYNLTWADMTSGSAKAIAGQTAAASALQASYADLTGAGYDSDAVVKGMASDVNTWLANSLAAGLKIPAGMEPIIEKLTTMGLLTDDNKNKLLGLATITLDGGTFADVTAAAGRYGIQLDALGPKVNQLQINQAAATLSADWKTLTSDGEDVNAVMDGMKGQVQDVVTEALKFGDQIPASMKDMIDQMIAAGDVTDALGNKLTDDSTLKFAVPLTDQIPDLVTAIKSLVDTLTNGPNSLAGALDGIGNKVIRPLIKPGYDGSDLPPGIDDGGGVSLPAHGAGGFFSDPHLAVVGDRPEFITPEASLDMLSDKLAARLGGGLAGLSAGGSDRPIIVNMDGQRVADIVTRRQPNSVRRFGVRMAGH